MSNNANWDHFEQMGADIVTEACKWLYKNKGLKIELQDGYYIWQGPMGRVPKFMFSLNFSDKKTLEMSFEEADLLDTKEAIKFPFISDDWKNTTLPIEKWKELEATLPEKVFIILCFAAWFWNVSIDINNGLFDQEF